VNHNGQIPTTIIIESPELDNTDDLYNIYLTVFIYVFDYVLQVEREICIRLYNGYNI